MRTSVGRVPVSSDPVVATARETLARPTRAPADAPKVLVVENNVEMNAFIADVLGDSYAIRSTVDGEEGRAAAMADPPDLVVTDLTMPRMSGDQLIASLRADPSLADVPILLVSASADGAIRTDVLRRGTQDYVLKPFSPDELRVRVANLVATKRTRDTLCRELTSQALDVETLALEVTQKTRDLEAALGALRSARDHDERVSQMKTEFIGLISHELSSRERSIRRLVELGPARR